MGGEGQVRAMRNILIASVAVVAVAFFVGAVAAFATGGSFTGQSVAGGLGSVATCDSSPAWLYSFTKNASGQVSAVSISNISAACTGGSMQVTLAGLSLASNGTATVIPVCAGTCSVTVPFSSGLLFPSEITAANALIVGP